MDLVVIRLQDFSFFFLRPESSFAHLGCYRERTSILAALHLHHLSHQPKEYNANIGDWASLGILGLFLVRRKNFL